MDNEKTLSVTLRSTTGVIAHSDDIRDDHLGGSQTDFNNKIDGSLQIANAKIATAQESIDYIANSIVPNMLNEISAAKTTAEDTANNLPLKQDKLVSGENIKTVNGQSVVGSGNVDIGAGFSEEERATISNLIELLEYTTMIAEKKDFNSLPLLCGQPMILFGAGTPQEAIIPDNWIQYDIETGEGYNWNGLPSSLGQRYINTSASSGGNYIAVRNGAYNLKWLNI